MPRKVKVLDRIFKEGIPDKLNVVGFSGTPQYKEIDNRVHRKMSIQVAVSKKMRDPVAVAELERSGNLIPDMIDGMPTDVVEIGEVTAMGTPKNIDKERYRPVPGGCSGIRLGGTACTTGLMAVDQTDYKRVMIVNDHCGSSVGEVPLGTSYIQPSPLEGGEHLDRVGFLKRRRHIEFAKLNNKFWDMWRATLFRWKYPYGPPMNPVDACVIGAINEESFTKSTFIQDIGGLRPPRKALLGVNDGVIDYIAKRGRTTGLTDKLIPINNDYYVKVRYSRGFAWVGPVGLAYGDRQVQGGDSSSPAWFKSDRKLAGQFFAASPTHAMYCFPDVIERELNVKILY